MFYIKTPKTVTVTGRKRILAVGTEVKKLGLDGGDDVIVYIMRPEDELQMDMLIEKTGSKFYLLFSENPDLIVARRQTEVVTLYRRIGEMETLLAGKEYDAFLPKKLSSKQLEIYNCWRYPGPTGSMRSKGSARP